MDEDFKYFSRLHKIFEGHFTRALANTAIYFTNRGNEDADELYYERQSLDSVLSADWDGFNLPVPEIKFGSVDNVLAKQENMKKLETDVELTSGLIKHLHGFRMLAKDSHNCYTNHLKDYVKELKQKGNSFLEFLEKYNDNSILSGWQEKLKSLLETNSIRWKNEEKLITSLSQAGIALYEDVTRGLSVKPIANFEESRNAVLQKLQKQIKKGVKKGSLNFGDVKLPFNLSLGNYVISQENKASIIKGKFPLYSDFYSAVHSFIHPFYELNEYLRSIYLTLDNLDAKFSYPKFNSEGEFLLDVKNASPLFLRYREDNKKIIKNNFKIHRDSNTMFVSGSNNGGKTTLLRTIALLYNMAYLGGKVPASNIILAPIEGIQIYEPVLGRTSGTFKQNLSDLKKKLEKAKQNKNYLNLFDEPIMGGTDTTSMNKAFSRFIERIKETDGINIVATNHSEYLREDMPFTFYKMNKRHKLSSGIGKSEGESIIDEVDF